MNLPHKVILYKYKLVTQIDDDLVKVREYFKPHGIDVTFDVKSTTTVKDNALVELFKPNDDKCDTVMYLFERGTFFNQGYNGVTFKVSPTLRGIYLAVSPVDDTVDYTWKSICHELMHALFMKYVPNANGNVPLDTMLVDGTFRPYYKNDDPNAPDGNFAEAWRILKSYINKDYFKVQEFVPKCIYEKYGENSAWFIDPQIRKLANFVRTFFGKPVTINNWHTGGSFDQRGFRESTSTVGANLSQHRFGRAIDINVAGMTPKAVYEAILANERVFMEAGLTCMESIAYTATWNHLDIRDTGLDKILIVNP